jgi:hypothetical protein
VQEGGGEGEASREDGEAFHDGDWENVMDPAGKARGGLSAEREVGSGKR